MPELVVCVSDSATCVEVEVEVEATVSSVDVTVGGKSEPEEVVPESLGSELVAVEGGPEDEIGASEVLVPTPEDEAEIGSVSEVATMVDELLWDGCSVELLPLDESGEEEGCA